MSDLLDYAYCKHCGRVLVWDDYGYTHLDGWAICRDPADQAKLSEALGEPLLALPIDPQPKRITEAFSLPILSKEKLEAYKPT